MCELTRKLNRFIGERKEMNFYCCFCISCRHLLCNMRSFQTQKHFSNHRFVQSSCLQPFEFEKLNRFFGIEQDQLNTNVYLCSHFYEIEITSQISSSYNFKHFYQSRNRIFIHRQDEYWFTPSDCVNFASIHKKLKTSAMEFPHCHCFPIAMGRGYCGTMAAPKKSRTSEAETWRHSELRKNRKTVEKYFRCEKTIVWEKQNSWTFARRTADEILWSERNKTIVYRYSRKQTLLSRSLPKFSTATTQLFLSLFSLSFGK